MLGLKSFRTATYILSGIGVMHMLKKKQVHQEVKSVQNQKEFIHKLFGLDS
jgi:transposase, IS6 family